MDKPQVNQHEGYPDYGLPQDARCSDPTFAAEHPGLCTAIGRLVLKPAHATVCSSGTIQFQTFITGSTEEAATVGLTYSSSNPAAVTINANTGLATLVAEGLSTISVTDGINYAYAQIAVLGAAGCCNAVQVETVIVVDNSQSMNQSASIVYPSKLVVAKAVVWAIIGALQTKDLDTLIWFNDSGDSQVEATNDVDLLQTGLRTVKSTDRPTNIANALNLALDAFSQNEATKKVIVLASDGAQRPVLSLTETADLINQAAAFKAAGGIIMCIGLRACSDGYELLNALATGGFFLNIVTTTALADAVNYVTSLMGFYCAGPLASPSTYATAQIPDLTPLDDVESQSF